MQLLPPRCQQGFVGLCRRGVRALEPEAPAGLSDDEPGAFSLFIEGVAESLARELTAAVAVPAIGIGGSPPATVRSWWSTTCSASSPSSRRNSSSAIDEIRAAAREYAEGVRQGRFPAAEHTYSTPR